MSNRENYRRINLFLLMSLFSLSIFALDIRSVWVTPWDLTSEEKIDMLIDDCVANNINEILAEVRYRGDALYFPNRTNNRFINNEARSYVLNNSDFDPLDYLIKKAKQRSIRVQAWGTVLVVTPQQTERLDRNHIYFKKREWITYSADRKEMQTTELEGAYLDPGIPEVRDYLAEIFADIALNYDVDGIQLDYARYPDHRFGFNPIALKYFNNQKLNNPQLTWENWKEQQMTELVKTISSRVKILKPNMQISVAVKPDPASAKKYFGQNWIDWLDKKYVDSVYLMAYHTKDESFNQLLNKLPEQYSNQIIVGVRAWSDNSTYPSYQLKNKIGSVINSSLKGIAFFSYAGINKDNYFSVINPLLKDMPGFEVLNEYQNVCLISGRVIGLNNQPISGVKITHLETQQVGYTDSNGNFVINDINESDDQIRIEYFDQNKLFTAKINHGTEIITVNEFKLNVFPANSLSVMLKSYSDNKRVYLAWISKDKKAYSLYRKRVYSPVNLPDSDYQFLGLMNKEINNYIDSALQPFCLYEYKLIDDQMQTTGFTRIELDFTYHPLELKVNRINLEKINTALPADRNFNNIIAPEYDFKLVTDDTLQIKWSIIDINDKPLFYGQNTVKNTEIKWNGLSTEGDYPDSPVYIFEYQIVGQKKWFRKYFF